MTPWTDEDTDRVIAQHEAAVDRAWYAATVLLWVGIGLVAAWVGTGGR
jgi:hypothetical protein